MDKEEIFNILVEPNRIVDLYRLSRFCYRVGEDLISDAAYEMVEGIVKSENLSNLVNQTYDDDDVPYDLLEEFNLTHLIYSGEQEGMSEYEQFLSSDKSMSIKALDNYEDVFDFFNSVRGNDLFVSAKVNGCSSRSVYKNEDYKVTMTRGRKENSRPINITRNASRVVPNKLKNSAEDLDSCVKVIYGEFAVDDDKYELIPRVKGGNPFTSSRMAALSILRVDVPSEWYNSLKLYAFNADGLSDTLEGTFLELKKSGFSTPPGYLVKAEEVPENFDDFRNWVKNRILTPLYLECKDKNIPTDGVVVEVNDRTYVGTINNQYVSKNCALKLEYWSHKYYMGIVKNIIIEQQAVNASVVIEIEPIKTEDNVVARRVQTYNLSYLVDNNIYIGAPVYFIRNSEAISVLLTGKALEEALNKPENLGNSLKPMNNLGGR